MNKLISTLTYLKEQKKRTWPNYFKCNWNLKSNVMSTLRL